MASSHSLCTDQLEHHACSRCPVSVWDSAPLFGSHSRTKGSDAATAIRQCPAVFAGIETACTLAGSRKVHATWRAFVSQTCFINYFQACFDRIVEMLEVLKA